jgi:aspartate/methionine/tyrosine aminotransferase
LTFQALLRPQSAAVKEIRTGNFHRRLHGANSKEKAMTLLKKTGVTCVPGEAFYHDDAGENLVRFCFAKEDAVLDEACRRLERLKGG